jgi:hypothetical protein
MRDHKVLSLTDHPCIEEVRMAEDQYETHAAALRVLGVGRVVERRR